MAGIFSVVTTLRDRISEERDEAAEVPVAKLYPHVPNLVTYIDHNKALPWTKQASGVLMFADISGFTALSERYSAMSTEGIDRLTNTLNEYLGSLVELILKSKGDVLKFAGDAILALWQTRYDDVTAMVESVAKCCIDIQEKCGLYETDVGVTLTVKMGVAYGDITFSFVGNDEFRHYVESGPAVDDVKQAEKQCQSGYVVLSPRAWEHCDKNKFQHVRMADGEHVRVMSMSEDWEDPSDPLGGSSRAADNLLDRGRRHSAVTEPISSRRGSLVLSGTALLGFGRRRQSIDVPAPMAGAGSRLMEAPDEREDLDEPVSPVPLTQQKSPLGRQGSIEMLKKATKMLGPMPKKLRLYVLSPVLKKLDDGQPLEYLSEMRQISVIFMNLSLAETDDISRLMQNLFTIVYRNVKNLQGCLNKIFLFDKGCSFLVIFGLPGYKHEQDCAYALQCSVGIADDLKEEEGVEEVSIGVTTGTAFCGVVGHKDRHEYSVIGRKVNMAARLMMYYPGAITCDDETFSGSRLPPQAFQVLPPKEMKGLQNVGTLREFVATGNVDAAQIHALRHYHYPILGRDRELKIFSQLVDERRSAMSNPGTPRQTQMLVIESEGGLGKTRLLDAIVSTAPAKDIRVVSCALYMEDINKPYFLAQLLLRMLLTNAGFSEKLSGANDLLLELGKNNLLKYLPLLKLIMGQKSSHLNDKAKKDKHEWETALHAMVNCVVRASLRKTGLTLFAVDDIHFADSESWKLLADMQVHNNAIFVVTMRPPQMNQKLPEGYRAILADRLTQKLTLEGLDIQLMCALACQMLDVVRIPVEINRILMEKSHGVPSWCEQLLQDLLADNQLQITSTDRARGDYLRVTVGPLRSHVTIEGDSRRESAATETAVTIQTKEPLFGNTLTTGTDDEVSESMMSLLKPATSDDAEPICVLHPEIKPEDLKIPESVKDMMIARLDALRAAEQMLVKCASVLAPCFYRKTLIVILPNQVKKQRADVRIENLLKSGIFTCGGTKTSNDGSVVHDCDCKSSSGENKKQSHCSILRFQNPMLRETVCDILLANQRLNLHLKAAIQLDRMANQYRDNLPKFLLGRDSILITENVNRSPGSSEPAENRPKLEGADDRMSEGVKWIRLTPSEACFSRHEGPLELQMDLKKVHTSAERQKSLKMLTPLYTMIAEHWRGASEKYKLLCILIEASFAALAMEQPLAANSLIEEGKAALRDFENTDKSKYTFHADDRMSSLCLRAKLERLQGLANQQQSFTLEAQANFVKALRILGHRQAVSKRAVDIALSWKLRTEKSRENCPSCYRQSRRTHSEKVSEQVYCLANLYNVHKEMRRDNAALLNAFQQIAKVRTHYLNHHQVILAFSAMISQCRRNGWYDMATRLENQLLTRCRDFVTEKLTGGDLRVLAAIYGESSLQSLTHGDLKKAQSSGILSAKISRALGSYQTVNKYLPALIQAQLATLKMEDCRDSLKQLNATATEAEEKIHTAWFYCCSLDMLLDTGQPVETFEKTMMFICWLYSSPDGLRGKHSDPALPSYIFIRFAVWNCRKRNFLEADRWFQVALDATPRDMDSFFALQFKARHIECLLLTLCEAKKTNNAVVDEKISRAVSKELACMKTCLKAVPILRPRFYHLCAYYQAQIRNLKRCEGALVECIAASLDQGNNLELNWSQYNYRRWTSNQRGEIRDSVWLSYSDGHVFDWKTSEQCSNDPEFYPWPIPFKLILSVKQKREPRRDRKLSVPSARMG